MARILLVDDEPMVLNALKRILHSRGYELFAATTSEEALDFLQKSAIDVIICDQNMPGMLGIDLLKRSREEYPDAVRILITGSSDVNVAISAINEGSIYYYLAKPWKNEEVISVVEKALADKPEHFYPVERKMEQEIKKIPVWEDDTIILINLSEVIYLTAAEGDVVVITEKGRYQSPDSLNSWEKKLGSGSFFRCHRSYIVNINKIEKISPWFNSAYNLKLKDTKETIPVSRNSTKKLKNLFGL
ncbi:MAG: LytTR family transcriptional regulator DNA-binding domain-containing protein [Dehalobacter sp.]|nr:LytTR family transcriptional regulator DNA-binding domain-containing protein [Dehalobacter sp.]